MGETKDTGYKKLKRRADEDFVKLGVYMKRAQLAERKVEKLKRLLLLTEFPLTSVVMNEVSAQQWNEFIKEFPDEGSSYEGYGAPIMVEDKTGYYVKFSDVEPLIEALLFYANHNNWRSDGGLDFHPHIRMQIKSEDRWLPEDETLDGDHVEKCGGKNARDAFYVAGMNLGELLKKAGIPNA
jgi:hypothetical protein